MTEYHEMNEMQQRRSAAAEFVAPSLSEPSNSSCTSEEQEEYHQHKQQHREQHYQQQQHYQQHQQHQQQHTPSSISSHTATLNNQLRPEYIDVDDDDTSVLATLTRMITGCVSHVITPRQLLGFLRVLKAITFCFLILTIIADIMYMIFLEILASDVVRNMAGGTRDTIIRIYGLILSIIALSIEIDIKIIVKQFLGLKGFVTRGALMFFIAIITGSHPVMNASYYNQNNSSSSSSSSSSSAQQNDDGYSSSSSSSSGNDDNYSYSFNNVQYANEMPASAIGFQMVTSIILGCCALCYITCGILCCDRFTRKAFLSDVDPRITTAIGGADYPEGREMS